MTVQTIPAQSATYISPATKFRRVDAVLAGITEIPAAILLVVEISVLFTGVIARYVFHRPVVWSDELASVLFLWLAMLGAVIALRRDEHMRLSVFVGMVSPERRSWLEAVAAIVVASFVLLILLPAHEYVQDESFITTPALAIPDSWRVAAIEVGAILMMVIAATRLLERSPPKKILGAVGAIAAVASSFLLARPVLPLLGNYNLLLFFVGLVAACVVIGVPIAFAFGVATMSYLALTTTVPLTVVVSRIDEGTSGIILLSVPLFIFLGLLIEMTGMAGAMVDFLASLLGHVRGGLAYVLLGAMYLVSGISGSKAADMAAVAPVLFPEMKRRGSRPAELVALLSSAGAMSETIPPSLVLITIGSVCGVSIAGLFTGGLLPALVLGLALVVVAYIRSRDENLSDIARAPLSRIVRTFIVALPALTLPFLIRSAVVKGVATATEVSTIGIATLLWPVL